MPFQPALVAPRAIQVEPIGLGTADCEHFVEADDGLAYAVKTVAKSPQPASEWFCHILAGLCGIPCPPFERIEMPDGSLAFGSRWEGGTKAKAVPMIVDPAFTSLVKPAFSRIHALDLFVSNEDRHLNNYLIRERRGGFVILAMDFGRAFLFRGWPMAPQLPAKCMTMRAFPALKRIHGFDFVAADKVLQAIERTDKDMIRAIFDSMPSAWLDASTASAIVQWWDADRQARIDDIRSRLQSV